MTRRARLLRSAVRQATYGSSERAWNRDCTPRDIVHRKPRKYFCRSLYAVRLGPNLWAIL